MTLLLTGAGRRKTSAASAGVSAGLAEAPALTGLTTKAELNN